MHALQHMPVGSEYMPVGLEYMPVGLQHRGVGLEYMPVGLQHRPVGLQHRPVGLEYMPVGLQHRPVRLEYMPVGLQQRLVGLEYRPVGLQHRPVGLEYRPVGLPNLWMTWSPVALLPWLCCCLLEQLPDFIAVRLHSYTLLTVPSRGGIHMPQGRPVASWHVLSYVSTMCSASWHVTSSCDLHACPTDRVPFWSDATAAAWSETSA
eukprot:359650-Chlamydomonas_euryale.AAC.11